MDDQIEHEGLAYNEKLADIGYLIQIIATDGYSVTLESAMTKRNNDLLVAYVVNENPLPDKYFPLRLVGNQLQKNQLIGAIESINLIIDPKLAAELKAATAPPTAAPTAAPTPSQPKPPSQQPRCRRRGVIFC